MYTLSCFAKVKILSKTYTLAIKKLSRKQSENNKYASQIGYFFLTLYTVVAIQRVHNAKSRSRRNKQTHEINRRLI